MADSTKAPRGLLISGLVLLLLGLGALALLGTGLGMTSLWRRRSARLGG
jgi:hypothetical protein